MDDSDVSSRTLTQIFFFFFLGKDQNRKGNCVYKCSEDDAMEITHQVDRLLPLAFFLMSEPFMSI